MNIDDPNKSDVRAREAHFLLAQFYYDLEQYDKAWKWYSKIQNADLRGTSTLFYVRVYRAWDTFFSSSSLSTGGDVFRRRRTERLYSSSVSETIERLLIVIDLLLLARKMPIKWCIVLQPKRRTHTVSSFPMLSFMLVKPTFKAMVCQNPKHKRKGCLTPRTLDIHRFLSLISWWLSAASDTMHEPVMEAETALAFLYSRNSSPLYSMAKAYKWHSRASHHGSLESLGERENRCALQPIDWGEFRGLQERSEQWICLVSVPERIFLKLSSLYDKHPKEAIFTWVAKKKKLFWSLSLSI